MNQVDATERGEDPSWAPVPSQEKSALLAQIRAAVADGSLRPGDRLPTERALAHGAGLSRGVVRDVLAVLERQGMLTRHVGRGTFVSGGCAASGGSSVVADAAPPVSLGELMAFRAAVEPAMIELVIFSVTEEELDDLSRCVAEGRDVQTWSEAERADRSFHSRLYQMSGNRLFQNVGRQIEAIRAQAAWTRLKSSSFSVEKWLIYQVEHEEIAASLVQRDIDSARQKLRAHLLGVRRDALRTTGDL